MPLRSNVQVDNRGSNRISSDIGNPFVPVPRTDAVKISFRSVEKAEKPYYNWYMKFLDPKNDVAFRKIFGDENKKDILISFLNNILEFAGTDKEIVDITIQNPYLLPKLKGLNVAILNVNAEDRCGFRYIIDILAFHTYAFGKRLVYYVNKAYYQQQERTDDPPKFNHVISLGFLDFVLFKETKDYATRCLVQEEDSNYSDFENFELNLVELPKFTVELEQLKDVREKWIYFVKNADNLDMLPTPLEEPVELKEAFELANPRYWSKEELDAYDNRGIQIQDERGRVEYAFKEGFKKGVGIEFERGEECGFKKGESIGFKKGKREIARAMLKEGMDPGTISRLTGLSVDEIKEE